jgi:uncharacterized protein (DUF2147 family)
MKIKLFLSFIFLFTQLSFAKTSEKDILGVWWSPKKDGRINIYQKDNKYYGELIWVLPEHEGKKDIKNPDKSKQDRPVLGIKLLDGFKYDDGEWVDGTIYDPDNGKTYSCYMKLKSKNKLKVRGYIGISLLGRTEIFTRFEEEANQSK